MRDQLPGDQVEQWLLGSKLLFRLYLGADVGHPSLAAFFARRLLPCGPFHADPEPYHAVGNSWANVFVSSVSPYDAVKNYPWGTPTASDSSWLINDALFDRYYISGIAPEFNITGSGYSVKGSIQQTLTNFFSADYSTAKANPVLRPYLPPGQTATSASAALAADDGYRKMGAYSLIDGVFNVNSTSLVAWTAFLRANRNLAIDYAQSGGTDGSSGSPFPSGTSPGWSAGMDPPRSGRAFPA